MPTTQYEIGVIGAGQAAEGIVHSVLRNTVLIDERIIAADPDQRRRRLFAERFGIAVTDDNRAVVAESRIIILAVKPQQFIEVCRSFADLIRDDHLIVSILAGVSTRSIEAQFPQVAAHVVRVMPNLPMHVGAGMAGVHSGTHAREADRLHAQRIFDAGGKSIVIEDESLMDAVTAVSGTGPAYFYRFVEVIIDAGVEAGLTRAHASILAKQTCLGAARMMLETDESPQQLRANVTSPRGTTEAAMNEMEAHDLPALIRRAVLAARDRSRELGR